MEPQMYFTTTQTKGLEVNSRESNFPLYQISITPIKVKLDDTYWCEYIEEDGKFQIKSNVWKSASRANVASVFIVLFACLASLSWIF